MVDAINYILKNNSTVQGLVGQRSEGTATDYKIFPVVVPSSETAPYVAVRLVSKISSGKNCGYAYTIQISSYAKSYDAVSALNDAIISAITEQSPGTVNGVDFGFSNFSNESDDYSADREVYAKILTMEGNAD